MNLKPRNEEMRRRIEELFEVFAAANMGSIVPHQQIDGILGLQDGNPRKVSLRSGCCRLVRKRLEAEHNRTFLIDHGVGYRICSQKEHLRDAVNVRDARISFHRREQHHTLKTVPEVGLSDHERDYKAKRLLKIEEDQKEHLASRKRFRRLLGIKDQD